MKLNFLRKKYPKFVYEKYSYKISGKNLEIFFDFKIGPNITFHPKTVVENVDERRLGKIGERVLNNLVFHLGLIEMPSYWKTTCAPTIEIRAGYLNPDQIRWWKKLFLEGLGQFYYENRIDWRPKNFLAIISADPSQILRGPDRYKLYLKDRYLVPFAGGRDSIVTLEDLKKKRKEIGLFTVNPIEKIQRAAKVSGIKKQIIVRRDIDQKLLELNKKGFLNGHTPFTSVLSFAAALCAVLFDFRHIAFSNEKSSNEGNVRYLGKTINHQWAKSSEFEKMFRSYARKYLIENLDYFSHLRKYGELEISKILANLPQYFPVFSSCNAGMRIGSRGQLAAKERWCGNCPKCLFVYLSLYPFLTAKELNEIFRKNIFENKKLLPSLQGLLGRGIVKPFECVGTQKESQLALKLSLAKARKTEKIPFLLKKYHENIRP